MGTSPSKQDYPIICFIVDDVLEVWVRRGSSNRIAVRFLTTSKVVVYEFVEAATHEDIWMYLKGHLTKYDKITVSSNFFPEQDRIFTIKLFDEMEQYVLDLLRFMVLNKSVSILPNHDMIPPLYAIYAP